MCGLKQQLQTFSSDLFDSAVTSLLQNLENVVCTMNEVTSINSIFSAAEKCEMYIMCVCVHKNKSEVDNV